MFLLPKFSLLLLLLPAYLGTEFSVGEYNDGRVLWSDPEDPVLASHIPEGWTLSQEGGSCRWVKEEVKEKERQKEKEIEKEKELKSCPGTWSPIVLILPTEATAPATPWGC